LDVPGSYQRKDFKFHPLSDKQLEMENLLGSMKSMGMGGSLFGKEDMEDMLGNFKDGYDEEDGMGDNIGDLGYEL
jgi:hypothetical protein